LKRRVRKKELEESLRKKVNKERARIEELARRSQKRRVRKKELQNKS
jgi:hypothetical protein